MAEAGVREAYVLKQLKNRFLWVGETVHHDVAHVLRKLSHGEFTSLEQTLTRARTRMRKQFLDSRARLYRHKPKEITGLCEHEYNLPVTPEQWKEAWRHVETCLRHFYEADFFLKLKKLGPAAWKTIEHRLSFPLNDVDIFVKLDLAFEEGGFLTIVDWKTGKRRLKGDALSEVEGSEGFEAGLFQLGCYALFANEGWGFPVDRIRLIESNLYNGQELLHTVNKEMLADVAGRIREEIRIMRKALVDPRENKAELEDFPMTENKGHCRFCNFQRLCYPQGLNIILDQEISHAI